MMRSSGVRRPSGRWPRVTDGDGSGDQTGAKECPLCGRLWQSDRNLDANSAPTTRARGLPKLAVLWQVVGGKHGGIVERSGTSKSTPGHLSTVPACHAGRSAAEVSSRVGGLT